MPLWNELANRFRYLTRRSSFESDFDREVRFHLEARAAELRAAGLAPSDAQAQARREFGSPTLRSE